MPPRSIPGQGDKYLCVCDDVNAPWCHKGARPRNYPYNITSVAKTQFRAAQELAAFTRKEFEKSGIPEIVKQLQEIATRGMSKETFKNFQDNYYPLSKCSMPNTPEGLALARAKGYLPAKP